MAHGRKQRKSQIEVRQSSMNVLGQTRQDVEVSGRSVAEHLPDYASAFVEPQLMTSCPTLWCDQAPTSA
jgi:hypothetical protein